jgi:nitrogen-specific signal transduction histidine kinase
MRNTTKQTKTTSSIHELLNALKIAFCYMPEKEALTQDDYAGSLPEVKKEVGYIRKVLLENNIDPDTLYNELNHNKAIKAGNHV